LNLLDPHPGRESEGSSLQSEYCGESTAVWLLNPAYRQTVQAKMAISFSKRTFLYGQTPKNGNCYLVLLLKDIIDIIKTNK